MADDTAPVDHRQRAEAYALTARERSNGDAKYELRTLAWAQYHATLAVHDALQLLVRHAGIRR